MFERDAKNNKAVWDANNGHLIGKIDASFGELDAVLSPDRQYFATQVAHRIAIVKLDSGAEVYSVP